MTEDAIKQAVIAERREQAELLATLTPDQWDSPTLCDGWRIREVVAHTTLPFRASRRRVVAELLKARGSFNRMADRCARRDAAELSAEELLDSLRSNLDHPWAPPGGGPVGALSHDVIHGLDITVGAGLDRRPPPERVALVLTGMRPRNAKYFGVDLTGVSLQATDVDWSIGTGSPVRGCAQDLLLAICGRRLSPGLLEGEAADRFVA